MLKKLFVFFGAVACLFSVSLSPIQQYKNNLNNETLQALKTDNEDIKNIQNAKSTKNGFEWVNVLNNFTFGPNGEVFYFNTIYNKSYYIFDLASDDTYIFNLNYNTPYTGVSVVNSITFVSNVSNIIYCYRSNTHLNTCVFAYGSIGDFEYNNGYLINSSIKEPSKDYFNQVLLLYYNGSVFTGDLIDYYNSLTNDYNSLVNEYNSLETNYNALTTSYNELMTNFNNLNDKYNNAVEKYTSLKKEYYNNVGDLFLSNKDLFNYAYTNNETYKKYYDFYNNLSKADKSWYDVYLGTGWTFTFDFYSSLLNDYITKLKNDYDNLYNSVNIWSNVGVTYSLYDIYNKNYYIENEDLQDINNCQKLGYVSYSSNYGKVSFNPTALIERYNNLYIDNDNSRVQIELTFNFVNFGVSGANYLSFDISNLTSDFTCYDSTNTMIYNTSYDTPTMSVFNVPKNALSETSIFKVLAIRKYDCGNIDMTINNYVNTMFQNGYNESLTKIETLQNQITSLNNTLKDKQETITSLQNQIDIYNQNGFYSFNDLMWGIATTPFGVLSSVFNVNILGVNVWLVVSGLISALLIVWLIKKLM